MASPLPGGFIPPSSAGSSPYSGVGSPRRPPKRDRNLLPVPRQNLPLKPGSAKESRFISYVDEALLEISRKYTKRFLSEEEKAQRSKAWKDADGAETNHGGGGGSNTSADAHDEPAVSAGPEIVGYRDMEVMIQDFEKVIMLVWVSGTASLQISYLLSIASTLLEYLPSFRPMAVPMFRILNRLDLAFATLLRNYKMSGTEKVRLASTVKLTRSMVLRLMESADVEELGDLGGSSSNDEDDNDDDDDDGDEYEALKARTDDSRVEYEQKRTKGGQNGNPEDEDRNSDDDAMDIDETGETERSHGESTDKEDTNIQKPRSSKKEMKLVEEGEDESWEMEVARVYERVLTELGDDIAGVAALYPSELS